MDGYWLVAALLALVLLIEYEIVVRWERRKHNHHEARLRPRPRRNRGRRY